MRKSLFLLTGLLHACGSSAAPITPPTAPASFTASIGGKPFVARSALVTDVNRKRQLSAPCNEQQLEEAKARSEWFRTHPEAWSTCGSTRYGPVVLASAIYIFERVVTCDELEGFDRPVAENEHAIEIDLTGVWPQPQRTTLRSHAEDVETRIDHADASFRDFRPSDGNSGYYAFGTVTFVEGSPSEGVLALDLADASGEATARGTVRVKVCP
jgi:hypothetical protein